MDCLALHDFYFRCNQYRWERVANLADEFISYIRVKKISKLSQYIFSAKKHDLFGAADSALYDELELLNRLRNRLHIQNENKDLEPDESAAFTVQRKELAERVLEQVLKTLSLKYPRPDHIAGWVRDFECDWVERVRA
ncbi:hypothetical protein [Bradyrhizobium sp.]|uniref:hypothetical protein n=1 Tax=Bradyrhizobium sp. TaxID=376 RepID=UPI003C708D37